MSAKTWSVSPSIKKRSRISSFASSMAGSSAASTPSLAASSSVSSASCSLSSTGSTFEQNGGPAERAKRVPLGSGKRQKFLFSRLGTLVDKDDKNQWGERRLGVSMPFQKTKLVDPKYMKPEELNRAKLKGVVYYCAPKELLYSEATFKHKKANSTRSSPPPATNRSIRKHPLKHAYMYHSYSECRCSKGGREVILEVELSVTVDALLPSGTLDDYGHLSPGLANVIRVRDIATGQTQLRNSYSINGSLDRLKRGQKLWYSSKMDKYFTEQEFRGNLRTQAEYEHFLASPPKVHSHH